MFRFLFYLVFGYIIMKILRIFIDPIFAGNTGKTTNNTFVPKQEEKKSTLGEYVDYEEVK